MRGRNLTHLFLSFWWFDHRISMQVVVKIGGQRWLKDVDKHSPRLGQDCKCLGRALDEELII